MWTSIKALFASRKFWLTVVGSAVVGGMQLAGVNAEIIALVAGLFGISIVSRAIGDLGPTAPK